jgi:transglutaminase-like putative cysteine protease
MPLVRIVHTTEYRYRRPVRLTGHRLMLRPRDSHDLWLINVTLGLTPPAISTRWAHDVFGNSICYLEFGGAEADLLRIVSKLELEHSPPEDDPPLDPAAMTYPFSYQFEEIPDLARLMERHYPDPYRRLDAWAKRFVNAKGPTKTMRLLEAMTGAIKEELRYSAREESGTQPPVLTLERGSGACRDLAVLMMEAARSLGLAARFISGYLYDAALVNTNAGAMVGGGATHAWCAIYLPGAGWVEFDPTNGLIAGRNLIRVSVARTPEQAVPVAGGYIGQAGDGLGMMVDVKVTAGDELREPATAF